MEGVLFWCLVGVVILGIASIFSAALASGIGGDDDD